jgi:hypothetical protein
MCLITVLTHVEALNLNKSESESKVCIKLVVFIMKSQSQVTSDAVMMFCLSVTLYAARWWLVQIKTGACTKFLYQ